MFETIHFLKRKFLVILVCIGVGIILIGCSDHTKEGDTLKIEEQFLTEMFTTNKGNRYVQFVQDSDPEAYYAVFYNYATPACIEKLIKNRMPIKYEKLALEEGISYIVINVVVSFEENGLGTFEVVMADEKQKDIAVQKATGQITLNEGKVNTFFLSSISKYE